NQESRNEISVFRNDRIKFNRILGSHVNSKLFSLGTKRKINKSSFQQSKFH
ncbi:unnamed protein product, partial [Musa textilis]